MKKIAILMAAGALAACAVFGLVSCSNDSDDAVRMAFLAGLGNGTTSGGGTTGTGSGTNTGETTGPNPVPTTGPNPVPTTGPNPVPTTGTGTGAVTNPAQSQSLLGKNISVKNFSKYSAIGAASFKSKTSGSAAALISASESEGDDKEDESAHLVGQDSEGNVETLSLESEGEDSEVNERPLQFFRAFKRFAFFMYWPDEAKSYANYGKLCESPQCNYTLKWDSSTNSSKYIYEPMLVLDKSNGKIYAIDTTEDGQSLYNSRWSVFANSSNSCIVEAGDRIYFYYTTYVSNKNQVNYYALKLTDNQLQASYIVKDGDGSLFSGIFVDRFGNLFTNGNNNTIKYRMAFDGSKTKINCADNLHTYSSDTPLYSVYYYSDGTFNTAYNNSFTQYHISYNNDNAIRNSLPNYYLDAMQPKLFSPVFMGANGYVYQACNDSSSREKVYRRFNADGQLEDCDWVPENSLELDFSPSEFLTEKGESKYYYVSNAPSYTTTSSFNYMGYSSLTESVTDFQLFNSNGQPATVKKYDFDKNSFTSEDIPVVLKSYTVVYSNPTSKKANTIYKVQFTDSSKNQYSVSEIPLSGGFTPSTSYTYGSMNYAATDKHIFLVKDGDLVAFNIEDGTKDSACCKSDAIYGSVSAVDSNKVFFTATSLSSNASISGTIDDNGNVEQNATNYEIKYLSPIE